MKLLELFSYLKQNINEAVELQGIELWAYAGVVCESYINAPRHDPRADKSYRVLSKSNNILFKRLSAKTDVKFTQDDPYKGPEDVARDIVVNNQLKVFSGGDPNPAMSEEENNIFRAVHDYFAHVGPNRKLASQGKRFSSYNFSYRGELNAYLKHSNLAPRAAVPVLFTEVVGQISYYLIMKNFAPQKATILDGFDYTRIGRMDQSRQTRYEEIMSQINDNNKDSVVLNLPNPVDYPKSRIGYKTISTSARNRVTA